MQVTIVGTESGTNQFHVGKPQRVFVEVTNVASGPFDRPNPTSGLYNWTGHLLSVKQEGSAFLLTVELVVTAAKHPGNPHAHTHAEGPAEPEHTASSTIHTHPITAHILDTLVVTITNQLTAQSAPSQPYQVLIIVDSPGGGGSHLHH